MDPEPVLGTLSVKREYTLDVFLGMRESCKNICIDVKDVRLECKVCLECRLDEE